MPTIQLSATQRLISTARVLEWQHLKLRKHRNTGEPAEDWQFYRNFTSLESALTDVVNVAIRASKHADIPQATQEVKDAVAIVCKALACTLDDVINIVRGIEYAKP